MYTGPIRNKVKPTRESIRAVFLEHSFSKQIVLETVLLKKKDGGGLPYIGSLNVVYVNKDNILGNVDTEWTLNIWQSTRRGSILNPFRISFKRVEAHGLLFTTTPYNGMQEERRVAVLLRYYADRVTDLPASLEAMASSHRELTPH
jgi:hypothetical protein